jgi:hypothetical protein
MTRSTRDNFAAIYAAAKRKDQAGLAELVNRKISLDTKDARNLFTPSANLAAAGDEAAVNLLRSFGASEDYIAMGYASAGNVAAAEKLRREKGVSIKYLVLGASLHVDHEYALWLQDKYKLSAELLISGAAYRGDDRFVEELIFYIDDEDEKQLARLAQINALISAGKLQQALQIRQVCEFDCENVIFADTLLKCNSLNIFNYRDLIKQSSVCGLGSAGIPHYSAVQLRDPEVQAHDATYVISCMDSSGFLNTEALLVYELAFVSNPDFLTRLNLAATKILKEHDAFYEFIDPPFYNECFKKFDRCYRRAVKIQAVMNECHFDFDQAHEFVVNPLVRDGLHAILAMQGLSWKQQSAIVLKLSTELPSALLEDMTKKYLLWSTKFIIDARLQRHYKTFNTWNPYDWQRGHLDRTESLRLACKTGNPDQIQCWLMLQFGLFNGTIKLTADLARPKHEQPLASADIKSEFYAVVKEIVESPRFKIFSGN